MFNSGIIAHPYMLGWSVRNTPTDYITLSNQRRTATIGATVGASKSFRAVRGISSGSLTWYITLDAVQAGVYFGVVGGAVSGLAGVGDLDPTLLGQGPSSSVNMVPSAGFINDWIASGSMLATVSSAGGQGSSLSRPTIGVGDTVKLVMNADTKVLTISDPDGSNTGTATFDAADAGPWFPACTLVIGPGVAANPQITLSYVDPT